MFHNPGFYKHLKAATKEASVLLHDIKSERIIPKGTINDMIANESSFMSCVQFLMEDLSIERLNNILKPKERREEIKKTLLHHIKKYLGSPYLIIIKRTTITGEEEPVTSHSLPDCLNEFNEQTFDKYYTGYEEYLSSTSGKPIKYRIAAALQNFDCDFPSSTLTLSNNARIVPTHSTFYVDSIQRNIPGYDGIDEQEIGIYEPPKFFLEIVYEMEKGKVPLECKEHIEYVSLEEIKNIFKILRLYKEGSFTCGFVYWCSKTPCDPPYNDDYILSYHGNYSAPNTYLLQEDDVTKLGQLLQKYTNIKEQDMKEKKSKIISLNSAIYYLDKGVRETDTFDRLVDYTAALESLLVDGKEGIASQLAQKTAFLLEKDRQKCREIFKDIKKVYGFRSNIVHGDYHKIANELELKEYCNKTERYARQVIIKWIGLVDKGMNRQEIFALIEENLFS